MAVDIVEACVCVRVCVCARVRADETTQDATQQCVTPKILDALRTGTKISNWDRWFLSVYFPTAGKSHVVCTVNMRPCPRYSFQPANGLPQEGTAKQKHSKRDAPMSYVLWYPCESLAGRPCVLCSISYGIPGTHLRDAPVFYILYPMVSL